MAPKYLLDASGKDAAKVTETPVQALNGAALGPDGNGKDGENGYFFGCKAEPTKGQPGNYGTNGGKGFPGNNGGDCWTMTITIDNFSGAPFQVGALGGKGSDAVGGARGGDGSDGGDAGKNTTHCKTAAPGGTGGAAGNGGDGELGGNGGNGGNVTVSYGTGLATPPVTAETRGGTAGLNSQPGSFGTPGKGGLNSDGQTYASPGGSGVSGKSPTDTPSTGQTGNFSAGSDARLGPNGLKIQIVTQLGS